MEKNDLVIVAQGPEKDLHPIIVDFLKDNIQCFSARNEVGQGYVGFADAFGIKDIGGQFKSNVIGYAVEVKKTTSSIAKKLGQALGYSLFSHRCYLASPKIFKPEHVEMANKLGVGLIQIDADGCEEILTAQHHEPFEDLFLSAVYNLGWSRCDICRDYFEHKKKNWTKRSPNFALKESKYYHYKVKKDNVYFSNAKRRFPITICPICLKHLKF